MYGRLPGGRIGWAECGNVELVDLEREKRRIVTGEYVSNRVEYETE